MGWKVLQKDASTTSTNDVAIRRAREGGGFEDGEVFVADLQTAGRGRAGRIWESPAGKNIYLSVLLKPDIPPSRAPAITLVAGAAVHEALAEILPEPTALKIKWPNDLYLNGRKVGGILTETESEQERVKWVVCGIGVNVNAGEGDFSPEVRQIATSLKTEFGKEIDRNALLSRLIETFEKRYRQFLQEGPAPAIAFCNQHSYLNGRRVTANGISGTAANLNSEGHLQIRKDDGTMVAIASGEVQCS